MKKESLKDHHMATISLLLNLGDFSVLQLTLHSLKPSSFGCGKFNFRATMIYANLIGPWGSDMWFSIILDVFTRWLLDGVRLKSVDFE
jgi:hypothetical protein